jgi:tetratricopeptide (TPR) repeat protein
MKKAITPLAWMLVVLLLSSCSTLRTFDGGYDSFEQGLALFDQGDFDSAIPYFQRATRDNPKDAQAYLYLGRSYISLSRWRSAIQPLRAAFRLAPHNAKDEIMNLLVDAVFAAALNDFKLGDRDSAPARLKEIL